MKFPLISTENYSRVAGLLVLAGFSLVLASCGMFGHKKKDKQPIYYAAVEAPPLEIPQGLDRPAASGALIIAIPVAPLPQREMPTVPPHVAIQSGGGKEIMQIKWSTGGVYLLVQDTPASTFRRIGLVIERSSLSNYTPIGDSAYQFEYVHDSSDPDEGFFSKMAFWRDDAPNYSGVYQAVIRPDGENSQVYIKNADGSDTDPDAAEHLLAILGERLG
jgi:uncharacterized lipoprotein